MIMQSLGKLVAKVKGSLRPTSDAETFNYEGFEIPVTLLRMTGGVPENWAGIAAEHIKQYATYAPLQAGHSVLEIGCGIGRDAFIMSHVLGASGRYFGIDIIRPSIAWCQQNITARFPNFTFQHFDIDSPLHNPAGKLTTRDFTLPLADDSVDRIVLHSVFTHMFESDIAHYLREFRRVLRPEGLVMASLFYIDDETERTTTEGPILKFKHAWGNGCFVATKESPEGAVAFHSEAFDRMLRLGGLKLARPIGRGSWNGRTDAWHGQDVSVLTRD